MALTGRKCAHHPSGCPILVGTFPRNPLIMLAPFPVLVPVAGLAALSYPIGSNQATCPQPRSDPSPRVNTLRAMCPPTRLNGDPHGEGADDGWRRGDQGEDAEAITTPGSAWTRAGSPFYRRNRYGLRKPRLQRTWIGRSPTRPTVAARNPGRPTLQSSTAVPRSRPDPAGGDLPSAPVPSSSIGMRSKGEGITVGPVIFPPEGPTHGPHPCDAGTARPAPSGASR